MIHVGDCLAVLPTLEANSVDACVTDPPYGLGFMGRDWDHGLPGVAFWREVSRVLKPGAHLVAFGGPRTWHRLVCASEDAGFEIRDSLCWLFGSGFPKSLNLGDGKGTALKPAYEPICLARKPLEGTVAANVAKWGTGALNVDGCRIGVSGGGTHCERRGDNGACLGHANSGQSTSGETFHGPDSSGGRWPANVLLDEEAAAMLDAEAWEKGGGFGTSGYGTGGATRSDSAEGGFAFKGTGQVVGFGDSGGPSRFFYTAKASRSEREEGLDRLRIVSYHDPSWVNAVLAQRLLAVTGLSPEKATEGFTIQDSDGSAWSMCWCGSLSTDPFHPAIQSIIKTATRTTTGSITSKRSARRHTSGCMAAVFGATVNGGSRALSAASASPWEKKTGISAKRGGPSMEDADLATSVASWLISRPVGGGHRVERSNLHPT